MKGMSVKIQKFGSFLSSMVMPNIGIFIGWGILAALFIDTGWLPNKYLNELVGPTLKYLLPILIGYTGGFNMYGKRGGVAGAMATMGVVIGADITMLIGGMIMGPIGAWCIKKVDKLFEGHIKSGMEMLVNNFSMGIVGALIMVIGYVGVEPVFNVILSALSIGVQWIVDKNLLPFTSIFVQPAQVLFLNNAINHGIMVPVGIEQAAETGKSILFLVEANGGTWLGLLLAFSFFGRGMAKKSAPGASLIMFAGGIGEVAFPYAMIKPWTILGPMVGNIVALFILQIFNGGTVAAVSPGSFFALLAMTPKGCFVVNILAYVVAAIVSFLIVAFFLKHDKSGDDEEENEIPEFTSMNEINGITTDKTKKTETFTIHKVVFACDAGMGSSVMGVSLLKTKMKKAMLDIDLVHMAINELTDDVDVVITNVTLENRVKETLQKLNKDVPILTVENFLDNDRYDEIVTYLKEHAK